MEREALAERGGSMNRNLWTGSVLLVGVVTLGVGSRLADRAVVQAAARRRRASKSIRSGPSRCRTKWILGQTIGVVGGCAATTSGSSIAPARSSRARCTRRPIRRRRSAARRRRRSSSSTPPATWSATGAGPGSGYDWPDSNHGITVDYTRQRLDRRQRPRHRRRQAATRPRPPAAGQNRQQDESQIGGVQSFNDNMVLKFTQDGKFLMQIGKPRSSKGSNDIANLRLPAKTLRRQGDQRAVRRRRLRQSPRHRVRRRHRHS